MTIVKRSIRNKTSTSSFKALAKYILDTKHDGEKLDYFRISNCLTPEPYFAIKEIEATQSLNQVTKNDKTYHLIVSFKEGEKPMPDQLKDIENTLSSAIGLSDHQRICAGHGNTDHYHLHIAINKIHPQSFHVMDPYYDFYKLSEACVDLELKHHLEIDNHIGTRSLRTHVIHTKPHPKLQDMISHGQEPLQNWIKVNALLGIKQCLIDNNRTWDNFHKILAAYHLEIKCHGNGFVIANKLSRQSVKASSVSRMLSKARLEEKLGLFQPPLHSVSILSPKMTYSSVPKKIEQHGLYQKYVSEKSDTQSIKKQLLTALSKEGADKFGTLKDKYRLLRLDIRIDPLLTPPHKKASTLR